MTIIEKTREFVMPFYEKKDAIHDFSHIERVLKKARQLAVCYDTDDELLMLGAYFHGVIHINEQHVVDFLRDEDLPEERIASIVQVAWESQRNHEPAILEGKILHDAQLLEGGKTFWVVKHLMAGAAHGEYIGEIVEFVRSHSGTSRCVLPESQAEFDEKVRFTEEFFNDLSANV